MVLYMYVHKCTLVNKGRDVWLESNDIHGDKTTINLNLSIYTGTVMCTNYTKAITTF